MRDALARAASGDLDTAGQLPVRGLFESVALGFWEDLRARYDKEAGPRG
ncbi:hypothetical protein [Streptomyces sp. NPDC102360]